MARAKSQQLYQIQERRLALRASLWPNIQEDRLWNRRTKDGWFTLPRTISLFMHVMNELSAGKPLGLAYLELWARSYDDSLVVIPNPKEMAYFSGFFGQRAERTWVDRMRILSELGFIDARSGPSGRFHYVLLMNPYHVIARLNADRPGSIRDDLFNSIQQRAIDVGAKDLVELERADGGIAEI